MSKGDDARRGLFGNMTSGGESARSGLRVRDCRHSTTGRPAQPPSRRFPPRISFLLFLFSRARSVFPTLASLPLLSPLPSTPLSPPPPPARVESSRYYRFSLDLPPPLPSLLLLLPAIIKNLPPTFRFFRVTPSTLFFSLPWKKRNRN